MRNRWLPLLGIMTAALAVSLAAESPQELGHQDADILQYEAREYDNIDYPGQAISPLTEDALQVIDERPLWNLARAGKIPELHELIDKYRGWYPGWQPPSDLLAASLAEVNTALEQARDAGQWQTIIDFAHTHPDEFNCEKMQQLWLLADAYHAHRRYKDIQAVYQRVLAECQDTEKRSITMQRAVVQLPFTISANMLDQEVVNLAASEYKITLEDLRFQLYSTRLKDMVQNKSSAQAKKIISFLEPNVMARRDSERAVQLGWFYLNSGEIDQAALWFDRSLNWQTNRHAAYGLALARMQKQDYTKAQDLAWQWRKREPRMQTILNDIAAQQVEHSYQQGNYQQSLEQAQELLRNKQLTAKMRRNLRITIAWNLFKLQEYSEAYAIFEALYTKRADVQAVEGLIHSGIRLQAFTEILQLAEQIAGPLRELIEPGEYVEQMQSLHYAFYGACMSHALQQENFVQTQIIGAQLAPRIHQQQDASLAAVLAWAYFKDQQPELAETWFAHALKWEFTPDAAFGLLLSKRDQGKLGEAEQLALQWLHESEDIRNLVVDLLLQRADRVYELKHYAESLSLATQVNEIVAIRHARLLIAWSHYQLGNAQLAQELFERLYRAQQDQPSAQGLAFSTLANDHEWFLKDIMAELGGPIMPLGQKLLAQRYFDRDLFILANHFKLKSEDFDLNNNNLRSNKFDSIEKRLEKLQNIEQVSTSTMPYARTRDGSDGPGELDLYGINLQARGGHGLHRFDFSIDILNLESGGFSLQTPTGSLGSVQMNSFNDDENGLIEPILRYRYDTDWAPYFSLGSTPVGGEINAELIGNLGIERSTEKRFWAVELFAENRQESILSISGLVDPFSGADWGRVVEQGVRAQLRQAFAKRWSISASATVGDLDGDSVEDNSHTGLGVGLAYDLKPKGFDYFAVGPRYQYESYRRNLSFFTFGHGGYFSPERFHQFGLAADFQTDETAPFVIEGNLFLAYQDTHEEDAQALPLTNSGPIFEGSDNSGVSFNGKLTGVYRLGNHLQLGAFVNYTDSDNFSDLGSGVLLRYVLSARPAVLSFDLPHTPWNQ